MAEKKYQKKSKKKSRRNLYDMVIFRIFAPVLYHNRGQKYEFLNITIHMPEETIVRDKQLEDKLVSALTEYIKGEKRLWGMANFQEPQKSQKFNREKVEKIWRLFFEIVSGDTKIQENHSNICNDLNKYLNNKSLVFSKKIIAASNAHLESYLHRLLKHIDNTAYNNIETSPNNGLLGTCCFILTTRFNYYYLSKKNVAPKEIVSSISSANKEVFKAITTANRKRNSCSHPNDDGSITLMDGEGMQAYVDAFFCSTATVFCDDLNQKGAGFKINVEFAEKDNKNNTVSVTVHHNHKIIHKDRLNYNERDRGLTPGERSFVFMVDKELFGKEKTITIEVEASAADYKDSRIKRNIERGSYLNYTLILEKTIGDNPPNETKHKTIITARDEDSPKDSSVGTDLIQKANDLSNLVNGFNKPYKCKKCGDSVAKESYDDHTQLCSKCHGEFRKHYDEGDSECDVYKKTLEKDCLRKAIEEYQKAKEYAYGETAENIESKIGQCHFYLEEYSKAFNAFIKSDSIADSLYYLGVCYEKGYGTTRDSSDAISYYMKAAKQEQALAQYTLGVKYYYGEYIKQNHKLAFDCFQKASKQNVVDAKYMLGLMYKNGEGVNRDENLAYLCFLDATNGKHLKAQYEMATYLLEGRDFLKKDVDNAFSWYKNAAEQGLPEAVIKVAQLYRGYSNYEPAIEWYRKAIDLNVPKAKEQLIATLLKRAELAHDMDEEEIELKLLLEATDLGNHGCYHNIADVYHYGTDKIKDENKAKEWYSKALSNGDYSTYIPIGDIYFSQNNLNTAEDYYRKAIEAGFIEGKKGLARLLNEKGDRILGNTYTSSVSTYFDSEIANISLKK